jgi:hypothetical protein
MFLGKNLEDKEPFWYPALQTTPPSNYTPGTQKVSNCFALHPFERRPPIGLIPILRKALVKSHEKGLTRRAALCYDQTVLIVRDWDVGWGCGFVSSKKP